MAYYNDLREFLGVLEENGKLVRIHKPIVRETDGSIDSLGNREVFH